MLTNYEYEVATTLVEALVEYGLTDHLAQYGEHGTENWFCEECMDQFGFSAFGGASKVCILHDDLPNWVIKVGYTEKVKLDYAKLEYENYCFAEEAGLGYYFPKTVYLGDFNGRPFYVQEMAECDENQVSSDWYERLRVCYERAGQEYDNDSLWCAIDCMDDDEKAYLCFHDPKLVDFLSDHRIGDLHEGNFGYIGGRMVIVDFSGWRG